jgi:hypothetical protein
MKSIIESNEIKIYKKTFQVIYNNLNQNQEDALISFFFNFNCKSEKKFNLKHFKFQGFFIEILGKKREMIKIKFENTEKLKDFKLDNLNVEIEHKEREFISWRIL